MSLPKSIQSQALDSMEQLTVALLASIYNFRNAEKPSEKIAWRENIIRCSEGIVKAEKFL